MVDSRRIFLDHEGTKIHGFLGVYFYIIFINVTMESYLDVKGLRVKVDYNFGTIVISNERPICTLRNKVRVYVRGSCMRIFVGAWVQ